MPEGGGGGGGGGGGTFGRIVLDLGLLRADELDQALELQRERHRKGDFVRLGHLLVDQGFLTPAQVQQVLQAQKISILTCEACGSQYNIRGYSPRFRYECPKCHGALKSSEELKSVAVQDQLQAQNLDDTVKLTRPEETNTQKIRLLRRLGKYEILGEIARGGMGIIYKARQLDLNRIVALKTLRQEEVGKPDSAKQFRNEAQAVAGLRHPNIVAVHEVGTQDGIEYFTMEFIEGLPLDRMLMREAIPPRRSVRFILPIAEALQYAHSKGVVHRDLKPANIIVDNEAETPFLVDFGIAEQVALEGPRKLYDDEEDLLGSIPYMAPEYVEGSAYDELCDLYSLGVVLYEALAGANSLPYYDDDTRKFLEMIVTGENKPITEWVPNLDSRLVRIVNRMIGIREDRYPSMNEVVRDLRTWLHQTDGDDAGAAQTPAAAEPARPAPQPAEARPGGMFLAVVGIAILALAGLVWTLGEVVQLRQELTHERVERERALRAQEDASCRRQLAMARRLTQAGQDTEAERVCTEIIGSFQHERPILADVYHLRGKIRQKLGKPGDKADLTRALTLSQQAKQ